MVEMKGLEEELPVQPQVESKDGGFPPPNNNNSGGRRFPISSKNDIIDGLCSPLNQDLLISKTFYFFFFSAFGSLFPLMAVYFKQMGMNPTQCGLLIGVRPFVEFLAAPFWGSMADRFRKGKIMLLFSLASWIVFTLALAFIQPPASSCIGYNETRHLLNRVKEKRSIPENHNRSLEVFELYKSKRGDIKKELDENFTISIPKTSLERISLEEKPLEKTQEKPLGEKSLEKNHLKETPLEEKPFEEKPLDEKHLEEKPLEKKPLGKKPSEEKPSEEKPSEEKPLKEKPLEKKPLEEKPLEGKPLEEKPLEEKPLEKKPLEGKPIEEKPIEEKPLEEKPLEEKLLEKKPLEEKPVEEEKPFEEEKSFEEKTLEKKPLEKDHLKNTEHPTTNEDSEQTHDMRHRRRKGHEEDLPPNHVPGKSPYNVDYTGNHDETQFTSYISPPFSSIVYKAEDVQEVFFLLMLLVVLGEFFSAPAITLADSATLCYLADNTDNYGKQRMFGSLGWGLAMFFVGIALDHSTTFTYHPCGPHERERNYTICFATFSVLMGCAFIASTQFRFDYDAIDDQIAMKPVIIENGPQPKGTSLPSFLTEGTVIDDSPIPLPPPKDQPQQKSTVFAQTTRELPEWLTVLRTFANLRYGAFLYVTWFMGFGIGLVFTFLFWHLQDLGGTPTLFGVASVINHVSEIFAYFFSFKFIRQIGHTKVLCIGLAGNVCRFLYISWLTDPWWVLPFEFVQGITHAAVWAACCSYITQATPTNLRSSAQGVLQGLHHGLGRGCGAVIGGIFVNYFGTRVTFRGYGFACLIVLILFIFINYFKADKGFSSFQDDQEPDTVVEETVHLAPHGVPSNPMARSLSKQNLGTTSTNNNNETGGVGGYGTADPASNTAGGFLGVPGGGGNYGGTGGTNYTTDLNMNPTIPVSNGALTRKALAAAFNPKGILAQASSPEALFEYQFIRRDFQAYDEVMAVEIENGNVLPKGHVLIGPTPKTRNFALQPQIQSDSSYSW